MTGGRQLVKQLAGETRRALFGHCSYCGRYCHGATCEAHRDLPQLEQSNEPNRTPAREARPGSPTKGE